MAAPSAPVLGTPNAGTTGATTYTLASHVANDIHFLATETNVTGGLTDPTSWVDIVSSPRAQGSNVTALTAWWLRATSSSETNPQVPAAADHQVGIPIMVRGCLTSGDPWTASTSSGQATGTTGRSFAGFSTVDADCLVLYFIACSADIGTDNASNFNSPTGLTGFTVLDQHNTTNGNGGSVIVAYGFKATAGAVGALTWDFGTTAAWSGIALALPGGSSVTALDLTAATETDAAVALSKSKSEALAPAAGTNAAVALVRQKARTATPSTETDVVVAIGRLKSRSITPATETETAVTLTGGIVGGTDALNLTPATETDTAVTITRVKRRTITPATETDVVVTVGRRKARTPTPVTEADAAQTLTRTKRRTATPSTETGSAPTLGRVSLRTLTAAAETAAGVVLGRRKARTLAQALEVDAAVVLEQQSAHQVADPDRLLIVHHEDRTLEVRSDPRRISVLFEDRVRPVFAESRIISIHEE